MDKVHSSWKLSGNIKGNLTGQTTKLLKLVGCKSESTPVKKVKPEKSIPSFYVNHHGVIPRTLYEALKSWYKAVIDFRHDEESQDLLQLFKKKIAKAILSDRPSRDTNYRQSKEYNTMNKKANTKLRRAEARLASTGGRARSCSCSRSR